MRATIISVNTLFEENISDVSEMWWANTARQRVRANLCCGGWFWYGSADQTRTVFECSRKDDTGYCVFGSNFSSLTVVYNREEMG